MAQRLTTINNPSPGEKEYKDLHLAQLKEEVAQHTDSLRKTMELIEELHESGLLEILQAMVKSKDKMTGIAVEQLLRPNVVTSINNVMALTGVLGNMEPQMTQKMVASVSKGLKKAGEGLEKDERVGIIDLMRALKDPDVNRSVAFGINLLKGMGEGLKEQSDKGHN
ncbi:DUF1641 domain-containing protein [Brevibacillus daliensis]|uniref:DUF1641 domain-containing protein n=1 Tax=Brevibacillus daliensis TaxID=2892995 RepID=UPI001E5E9234|nr:DUF1641 domain-containing protein [Brevibacillus daliensis]